MKIDIESIDRTQFQVHEHVLNGEVVCLVQPQLAGVHWTQKNKIFRSSLWNYAGELISASFPKFTNFGENNENFPVPESLKKATVVEKLDGSTLVLSKYNGNYILRTRGTVDASKLTNGYELDVFRQTILPKFHNLSDGADTWKYSIVFEWLSPTNIIVLRYDEQPTWKLIGFIEHNTYSLARQDSLDRMAKLYDLERPETYTFTNDLKDLIANVEQWKDREGVVLYSGKDQVLHKIKAAHYLMLHRMKSELSSTEKVMDVWLEQGMPDYNTFYSYIATTFDYELAENCRGTMSKLCDAYRNVNKIIAGMTEFVKTKLLPLSTRKAQAELVLSSYGKTSRASFVFSMLDGKTLTKKQIKKLMFQVLK